jgi:hypothetical protein
MCELAEHKSCLRSKAAHITEKVLFVQDGALYKLINVRKIR